MKSIKKERIDKVLVSRGFADSRTKAQYLLMAGKISVDGERVEKSGTLVQFDATIEVHNVDKEWVSRGALKLVKALDVFSVAVDNRVCVDIGASTGGFTQVLLSCGARLVFAVDVGYGQLAWSLRNDSRVIVMERTNARSLLLKDFTETPDIAVADASFISLKLILPVIDAFLPTTGEAVVLIKPQFELGKGRVGKGGVVRDKEEHIEVLNNILEFCSGFTDFKPIELDFSPITGPKGNIEYLMHLAKMSLGRERLSTESVVEEAHSFFAKSGSGS